MPKKKRSNKTYLHWVLGLNDPKLISGTKPGKTLKFPSRGPSRKRANVDRVRAGYTVIGYEGGKGKKGIVSIFEVERGNDGMCVLFKKVENLASHIPYSKMKACPELKDMLSMLRGLHPLEDKEYYFIMDLITGKKP